MQNSKSKNDISFFINGKKYTLQNPQPNKTLLQFLRENGLTGTKYVCGEGGCGACTVMLSHYDKKEKKVVNRSVASCLFPLLSLDGMSVTTVEGIGNTKTGLSDVQKALVEHNGSQCGYCSPGFVMSMTTYLHNHENPDPHDMIENLDGNLCRCTGYRPMVDSCKSLCSKKCREKHNIPFPEELKEYKIENISIDANGMKWFQPTTLDQLLEIKKQYPSCKIVCGNTEIGIETKIKCFEKDFVYDVRVNPTHIPELSEIHIREEGIEIGVGTTLTKLAEFLKQHIQTLPEHKKRGPAAIINQLKYFAGTQIRNVATIGGNIATASPTSDLNPLWAALDAYVNIISTDKQIRKAYLKNFFLNYRVVDLKENEILLSIFVPYCRENEFVQSFKQAKRREDDIAIVNAGMRMNFKETKEGYVIDDVSLVYGGMWKTIKSATKTQEYLKGKQLNDQICEEAIKLLKEEFTLPDNVPGGMPKYRTALVLSFFYKFYLQIKDQFLGGLDAKMKSAIVTPEFPVPESLHSFEKKRTGTSVGETFVHQSAPLQVSGEAMYLDDLPKFQNEKYADLVLTSIPRGRIKRIDASAALKMPGVCAWINAKDIRGSNKIGPVIHDEDLFVYDEVVTTGQFVGVIVADTLEQARAAAKAVVVEYEEMEPILTIEDAIAKNSFLGAPHQITRGDIEKGLKECDFVVTGEMRTGPQEHFYFETQTAIAIPSECEMTVISSTQNLTEVQKLVATALGIDENKVVAKVKRLGGGFGGKESRAAIYACAAAVAADVAGLPVRLVVDRDVDMCTSGQRHEFLCKYKIGFNKDGKIKVWDTELFSNAGYSLDLSQSILDRALLHIDNIYYVPNVRTVGKCCKTNLPSNTAFRGFGAPQGLMFAEIMIERVAKELNMTPEQIREINMYKKGDTTHFGQVLDQGDRIERLWKALIEKSEFEKRKVEVENFNKANQFKKRGIAVIPVKFGISFTVCHLNQGGSLVQIYTDGTVLVSHGGVEMGQGLHTKIQQIAATALGIPMDKVYISETSTDKVPNTSPTAASVGSDLFGAATLDACMQLYKRLEPFKKKLGENASFKDVVKMAYLERTNLSAAGYYRTPNIGYVFNNKHGSGRAANYFSLGVACSEVEIDILTGDFRTIRTDIVMDVGDSLNPSLDIGQIEGAFIQGLGLFTMEEVIWGDSKEKETWIKKGHLRTKGPGTYKIPSIGDIPLDFRIHLLDNCANEYAVYRSKAIGEPPLFMGASVFFAIKDAISSARKDSGVTGFLKLNSPATSEKIRMSCEDKIAKLFK